MCSVAIVSLWLCVPPVGGNSPLVAIFATDFFCVNSQCKEKIIIIILENGTPTTSKNLDLPPVQILQSSTKMCGSTDMQ